MVYKPQDRVSAERGFSGMPLRIAAALDLKDFKCTRLERIEIDDGADMNLDFEP